MLNETAPCEIAEFTAEWVWEVEARVYGRMGLVDIGGTDHDLGQDGAPATMSGHLVLIVTVA